MLRLSGTSSPGYLRFSSLAHSHIYFLNTSPVLKASSIEIHVTALDLEELIVQSLERHRQIRPFQGLSGLKAEAQSTVRSLEEPNSSGRAGEVL